MEFLPTPDFEQHAQLWAAVSGEDPEIPVPILWKEGKLREVIAIARTLRSRNFGKVTVVLDDRTTFRIDDIHALGELLDAEFEG